MTRFQTEIWSRRRTMGIFLGFLFSVSLFQVLFTLSIVTAERSDTRLLLTPSVTSGERHSEEYCAMYDICGQREDGKLLNCPYSSPSVKPDELLSSKIQSLCPTITGNVCCTEAQFNTLRQQVQQVRFFFCLVCLFVCILG
ncbi:uncharacterized protein LOC136064179 [Quercus suber]|uniref:uncharacterized protein LOC136064179 n=1 Tax=Quercus suber TaxID=58331 RepID=UPI0032DE97E1